MVGNSALQQKCGLSHCVVRSTPACSSLGSDSECRNTPSSREGGGMRSYLYHPAITDV